jgi:hypothetical protein
MAKYMHNDKFERRVPFNNGSTFKKSKRSETRGALSIIYRFKSEKTDTFISAPKAEERISFQEDYFWELIDLEISKIAEEIRNECGENKYILLIFFY